MVATMISVLLVDDFPVVRRLARQILERHSDIHVIGEADTAEEAVEQVARHKPSIVVIDIQLPRMTGIQATTLIKRHSPSTTVIGLTAGASESTEMAMRDAGAATVLNKEDLLENLYSTIIEEGMVSKICSRMRQSQFDQACAEEYISLLEGTYKEWKRLNDPPPENKR
jgi:DNA-binding NarL/FixJ family response regulator